MSWQPLVSQQVLFERARILRSIRHFLDDLGYLEVNTPALLPSVNPDPALQPFTLQTSDSLFLQTSPEFAMKRLLAAGSGSIYQICPAFRDDELGRNHHREFTMLEWYVEGFDYRALMDQVEALINHLADSPIEVTRCSYRELFRQQLKIDIDRIRHAELQQLCERTASYGSTADLTFQQCLDLLLVTCIEPDMSGYQLVYDYPAAQSSLAKPCTDHPGYVQRFELFHNGLELANGFSELTDASVQRQRFEQDNKRRQSLGLPEYELDELFLAALEEGLPECAGVAVGIDRLLMALLKLEHIDQVLSFRD